MMQLFCVTSNDLVLKKERCVVDQGNVKKYYINNYFLIVLTFSYVLYYIRRIDCET